MKVRELIEKLKEFDMDDEVVTFAKGNSYPVLDVQNLENFGIKGKVEIGCGWGEIDEDIY